MVTTNQPVQSAARQQRPNGQQFQVYNGLLHENLPDLGPSGIVAAHIIDRGIWPAGTSHLDPPEPELVHAWIAALPDDGAPIVMDFEFYDFKSGDNATAEALRSLTIIADTFQRFSDDRQIGFYGYLPTRDYWRAIRDPDSPEYREWARENTYAQPLEPHVDCLFPSIYTFYEDRDGWERYARAQIREARRISDKSVFAFLWPDYHNQGRRGPPRTLPADYWRHQLEVMRETADGIVLWGGWDFEQNAKQQWDDSAPWWRETRAFLASLG